EPGALLGGRYRMVGRLGRGGMGEVYRADDLKLGQAVALKFLPPEVDRDPARLTQLHTEVRMARQVAHPNVCRVYDIDEVEGHTFLSMEYVDGEDLSSLLKRIGRFPEDRALEIARQACAGLAAAHERGVVHRDFKPANVMLDGTGKVRITDFGLAGVAGEAIRAGTPAYMAPEQIAGREVTVRSDIYALGLVLYEVFTGQRALEGRNLAELIHKREQSGIVAPSAIVKDLNPEVERAIMRCLRPAPAERPSSALAVSAALPGGDPLAAALAAGETPSPEVVAAAGSSEAVSLRAAMFGAVWIGVALVAILLLYQRVMLINRIHAPKPPEALLDRAQEALGSLGFAPLGDSAYGVSLSLNYARFLAEASDEPDRWAALGVDRPATLHLWYRTSPRLLVPLGADNDVSGTNPPLNAAGMALVVVDAEGRLAEFHRVPPPIESANDGRVMDWSKLFSLAGLSMEGFTPVAPEYVPVVFADERRAWEGRTAAQPGHTLRIEAAAHRGEPVFFGIVGPWTRSARAEQPASPLFNVVISNLAVLIMPALMIAAAVLARRNVNLGRGDRRGAFRAASVLFYLTLAGWLLGASPVGALEPDIGRLFSAIGRALFDAALLWLAYLGLEPYVRRFSPDSLIGWTRAIAGRWQDPRVAFDVLIGISAGLGMTLLYALHNVLPLLSGQPEPMPLAQSSRVLLGARYALAAIMGQSAAALSAAMLGVVGIVALLIVTRRRWLAAAIGVVCYTPVALSGMFPPGTPWLDIAVGAGIIGIFILVIIRFGLLATAAALTTHFVLLRAPITTDFASWRGSLGLWHLGLVALFGLGACYVARRKE
ncbi:MAG TPA: serine/threonine-protein kinase, partial [Vicinamibacterales bacterium]|nr:serine/threonine-protein kinase [Vicinamibacterales bacterium]